MKIDTYLGRLVKRYGEKTVLISSDQEKISYSSFYRNVLIAESFFSQYSFSNAFCFSIISANNASYLYAMFALQKMGGTAVNLNPNLSKPEIIERLQMVGVQTLICSAQVYETLQGVLPNLPLRHLFVFDDGEVQFKTIKNNPEVASIPSGSNAAFLQFTGGTTGVSKAAEISHQNVLENIRQLEEHFTKYMDASELKSLIAFPFYHIFSVVFNVLFIMSQGGCLILYKDLRDTNGIVSLFREHKPNFTVGVNTWYKKLLQSDEFCSLDLSQLRVSLAGGEYVPLTTKNEWRKLTGKPLFSAYGLTETSSLAIISLLDDDLNDDDSLGYPISDTFAKLINENNQEIREKEVPGELLLKGPQITKEYYYNPQETERGFLKGWLKTGDIAVLKEGGFYKLVDRKKDMISVSGNKVYPNEVEEVLLMLEDILDVGVVGKNSKSSGEEVAACLVLKPTIELSDQSIMKHCEKYLSRFKLPKHIYRYQELPKTPIGKTARRILRNEINEKDEFL